MKLKKIVLIDDEKLIRITTSMLLKHNGFEVFTAENGEKGLTVISEQTPDIVLLDIMMPGMDGWEVFRTLRKNEKTKSLNIIIFTACDLPVPDDISDTEINITILNKPFHLQQLLTQESRVFTNHLLSD
ncbi:MAG: response regulator [Chitinispirillaceae bacterium]|nr:response regulator [Chitinispirillaceae bacterium]